jgi:hypothetical protein
MVLFAKIVWMKYEPTIKWTTRTTYLMRHGVDNEKHRPVGNPKRKV